MSRENQVVWPVLALLASFLVVFGLTWFFASDRRTPAVGPAPSASAAAPTTPPPVTPAANVLALSIVGPEPAVDGQTVPGAVRAVVPGVLERRENRLCLTPAFADAGWHPEDERGWDLTGTSPCHDWPSGQPLDLRLVKR